MSEPWVFIILLRHYVSLIAQGKHEYIENHAVKLVKQGLGVFGLQDVRLQHTRVVTHLWLGHSKSGVGLTLLRPIP
jgi:hypothetical protein